MSGCILANLGPTPTLTVNDDNTLSITFLYPLKQVLTKDDITSLQVTGSRSGGYDFTWIIVSNDNLSYTITLEFTHTDIPENTKVEITLSEAITDREDLPI